MIVPEETGTEYSKLVARAQHLSRDKFVAERPHPALLLFGAGQAPNVGPSLAKTTSGFATVIPGVTSMAKAPKPQHVYDVVKRPGANAFALMVTVGRATNNDVVLVDGAVSKFHLSFTQRDGKWLVTDSSTHGTWLDGNKLVRGAATPIESTAMLTLARQLSLCFLSAEDLFSYLVTGRLD
jgi:hypothetical protein